ncbi:MAG TPA: biopolymer transporter ExbD [Pirellulales bacterium]|jgi:biopolymer transport protein ExbD
MSRRRKRKELQGEVELNLTAMLDMAFQLLAFFILTFKPAPMEGYIALRMPPPQATTKPGAATSADQNVFNAPVERLQTLMVTIKSAPDGNIGSIQIEEGAPSTSLAEFEQQLNLLLGAPGAPFEQVILQVGSGLHYDSLVRILDICSRVKLASGEQLTKLSITELPEQSEP